MTAIDQYLIEDDRGGYLEVNGSTQNASEANPHTFTDGVGVLRRMLRTGSDENGPLQEQT